MPRIKGWTTMTKDELWTRWRSEFTWDDQAILQAIWVANRLVKPMAVSTRRQFYALKDEAIQRYGEKGRKARQEEKICFRCEGSGEDPWDDEYPCHKCGGSGIFASRWLFVHEFDVCGQRYCFHSYLPPKTLLDGQAEDAEHYGGSFTDEEFKALGLPLSGLLRILRYVATERWQLKFWKGRYYPATQEQLPF